MIIDENSNICLSGGAEGADLQWGMVAGLAGHQVIHWGFEGHSSDAPVAEVVTLTPEQLAVADDFIERANITLKRRWPVRSAFVANLLRRNFYQISSAGSIYAVSEFDADGQIKGGTAWAVQMFIDRVTDETYFADEDAIREPLPAYVFDQVAEKWFQWNGHRYVEIETPPVPSGIWAGVGTRKLNKAGKESIRNLIGYEKQIFSD